MPQHKQNQISPFRQPERSQSLEDDSEASDSSDSEMLEEEIDRYLERESIGEFAYYPGVETEHYEYDHERLGFYKTSFLESVAHLIKGTTGVGALTMHEAFKYGGLWTSVCGTVIFGLLNAYTMYMLTKSAQLMYSRLRVSKLSYPELAEVAVATSTWLTLRKLKKVFRHLVSISLTVFMCGTCCIYLLMIASTLKQIVNNIFPNVPDWLNHIRVYILISSPLLLGLCLIRSLKYLAPFALVADIFTAVCVLATLYYSTQTDTKMSDLVDWKNTKSFLKFSGYCIYCTSGISICLPVENNMKRPAHFPYVLAYAMTAVIVWSVTTGFFGYWGWGEDCHSPVTNHMPVNLFTLALQCLMYIMLSITFVTQFWVPFGIIWHYIAKKYRHNHKRLICYERLYRIIIAGLVTGVAILFPELIPVMAFVGLFVLGFISFVIPSFIETAITWHHDRQHKIRWRLVKNTLIMFFGFFVVVISFTIFFE